MFGSLREGSTFGGGTIERITAVTNGSMHVFVRKAGTLHDLQVGLAAAGGPRRYQVAAFGSATPAPETITLASALFEVLRHDAPPPAGLRPIDSSPPTRPGG